MSKPPTIPTIFFDDDPENIDSMQGAYKQMECRLISREIPNPLLEEAKKTKAIEDAETKKASEDAEKSKKTSSGLSSMFKLLYSATPKSQPQSPPPTPVRYQDIPEFKDNSYAKLLKDVEGEDNDEGINESMLTELNDWITSQLKTNEKVDVVFDWDRTLSCVEGVWHEPFKDADDAKLGEILVYLMGGKRRLSYLKEFFDKLDPVKVNIIILTNNPIACAKPDKSFMYNGNTDENKKFREFLTTNGVRAKFVKLIQLLIPQFKEENLLYSQDYAIYETRVVSKGYAFGNFSGRDKEDGGIKRTGKTSGGNKHQAGGKRRRKTIRVQKPTRRIAKKTSRKSRKRYSSP